MSAFDGESHGFFAYYRVYARSGVHAAATAALTAFGLIATYTGNNVFILLAIAVYILPPVFLYLTGEGENVPSVVGDDTIGSDTGGSDQHVGPTDGAGTEPDSQHSDPTAPETETGSNRHETTDRTDSATESIGAGTETAEMADTPDADAHATDSEDRPKRRTDDGIEFEDSGESDSPDDAPGSDFDDQTTDSASESESTPTETDSNDRHSADAGSDDGAGGAVVGDEPMTDDTDVIDEAEEPEEADATTDIEAEWTEVDTPTDESLLDVVATADGAFAVGESGVVLARDGEGWSVAVEDGPTANANPLRGVDATADGEAVWFAGDSGVLGRYADGRLTDHSAPKDQTSTWTDVAVTGKSGGERVHLVNGSGELLQGEYEEGRVSWGEIEKPGSGSSIAAIDFTDDDRGHLADTNQSVYETTDGGGSYEKIGIEDANAAFTAVAATDSTILVTGDDGSIFRYDGAVWTRLNPSGNALSAVDLSGETGLAAGDAGAVFELVEGGWESVETPTDADLVGVVCDANGDDPDVAVGTAGTVIERER